MSLVDTVIGRFDEFVAKAISTAAVDRAAADAAYRDVWPVLTADERQFLSLARTSVADFGEGRDDWDILTKIVRARLEERFKGV